MKKTLLTLFTLMAVSISLKAQEHLSDRWKETQRLDLKKKAVSYADTLRLSDVTQDAMNVRKGAFQYKGSIANDVLDVGYLIYQIMKFTKEEIWLRDEENIHVFTRESKDMSAADASIKKAGIDLPASPVSNIDHQLLKGNWEAYKRSGRNGPLEKVNYKTLLKTLSFELQKPEDYYGSITTNFIGGDVLYYIKGTVAPNLVVDDKDKKEHLIKVWKLTSEELVIEDENGIIYYMKHFL